MVLSNFQIGWNNQAFKRVEEIPKVNLDFQANDERLSNEIFISWAKFVNIVLLWNRNKYLTSLFNLPT